MQPSSSFTKTAWTLFFTVLTLALTAGPGLIAHDDSMPGNGQVPPHARDTMRAFHEDHHHNENLPALGITACDGGLAESYPCSNVDLMAFLPLAQIGGGNGNDIWGWTDPVTGKEFAIMGLTNGTAFVDISDPVSPVYYGHLPPPPGVSNSSWRDIKVYADHAYIGSEALGSGLQVFDLTVLRGGPSLEEGFTETAHYTGFSTSHNIVINPDSGFAYAVGTNNGVCSRGIHFIDLLDPADPQAAGCFGADGYTHDAQCVTYSGPDLEHQGKEICFAFNEDTLTIVDVTNKAAPVQLSRTGYANRGYSHQGWLTEDHAYLLLDDELDERDLPSVTNTRTLIWNVQDLDNPDYFADYFGPSTAIDHNQYVVGNYSYQANYRSGLRILDISDIANGNLTEAGYFDIYPSSDSSSFNGAWSVYPFFASGNVVLSGIEQGLYLLRPQLGAPGTPPAISIIAPPDGGPDPLAGTVQVRIDASDAEDAPGTLTVKWQVAGSPWQPATWDGLEYVADWDTTTVSDGPHTIDARAIDSDMTAATDSSSVTVSNGLQFTVDGSDVSVVNGRGSRNHGEALVIAVDDVGDPVIGVAVSGTFSGDWGGTVNGTTDEFGEVVLSTPPVKGLSFVAFCVDSAARPGWGWDVDGSTLCGDSNGGGAFGSVSGRVADAATGSGISNAAVSVDTGQSTTTDAFGDYSIADVPAGDRTVTATASGYESQDAPATVVEGSNTVVNFDLTESPVSGSGTIRGIVYSSAGGKVGGATVQVVGGSSSLTNKAGKYTIQNVSAGLQTVTATKPGYDIDEKEVDVPVGSTVTVDFTLTPQ
jgi:choice-of-anchor B domain-containing protein